MKDTQSLTFQNYEVEDIEDVLPKIERSFDVKFPKGAFLQVKTFGDLCEVVVAAVDGGHQEGCTTQQAFYRLRTAIAEVQQSDVSRIVPATSLKDLFPRKGRRRKMRELRRALGVELGLLEMKLWVGIVLICSYSVAIIYLFIRWPYGLLGLLGSYLVSRLASYLANELPNKNVGEAARLFVRKHYHIARRHKGTVNPDEIVPLVKETFMKELGLASEALTPEAPLF